MTLTGTPAARAALADTPRQLAVLRQAGVVDAGAQGFVDLLEGIADYLRSSADRDDNKPLVADNLVVIESMVVVDARVNTVAGLTLVPNNAPPPANNDSSGGSFGWFLLPLGLLAFRQRR